MHTFLQFFVGFRSYVNVQAKTSIMYNFELHPEFYNLPVLLNEEEKQEPLAVIRKFFEDINHIEVLIILFIPKSNFLVS